MTDIDKIDPPAIAPADAWLGHPAALLWTRSGEGVFQRVHSELHRRGAHPTRTVVVLPYAQLLPWAARWWVHCFPDSFAPCFETTMNWSNRLGGFAPAATDIHFDMALDTLAARAMLRQAGMVLHQNTLAGLLVQAAYQLAPVAAACPVEERAVWARSARESARCGMDAPALALEAAVAQIAVEWAAQSGYASDVLFDRAVPDGLDCLVMVEGFSTDPLAEGLKLVWGDKLLVLSLVAKRETSTRLGGRSCVALHACHDAEDEAQRSAACLLRQIQAGRTPVAFASTDRALTRRVRAMLEGSAVRIRDENGWKLSTSRVAASVMALLRSAAWNASTDTVLGWLKSAPSMVGRVDVLERAVRRNQLRDWQDVHAISSLAQTPEVLQTVATVNAVLEGLQGKRMLSQWLEALQSASQASGLWELLLTDDAGRKVLEVLHFAHKPSAVGSHLLEESLWSAHRMDLAEFTSWVNDALEGASFATPYPEQEQVVILPIAQMLGRPFAAVVLAGCDEVRLNPSPEPPGQWTAAQRAGLGLPSREAIQSAAWGAWEQAMQTPVCEVLWRCSDEAGETLLPGAWVQMMQTFDATAPPAVPDPRVTRWVEPVVVLRPQPTSERIVPSNLSASAYNDLRQCPYRFFALRQLGLQAVDELDVELDKRDFGLWLHEVLKRFHETVAQQPDASAVQRHQWLEQAAFKTTEDMALPPGEFLPFAAAWPAVRDGYLQWLGGHEASGAVFERAETSRALALGKVTLVGRIDRVDRLPDGRALVLDYKTEPAQTTRLRTMEPLEDTQMAFYAALLPDDSLEAAYVNVGERDGTRSFSQSHILQARDALVEGILHDMQQISGGATLPALGEGLACEYCQARGLCRKDFWAAP